MRQRRMTRWRVVDIEGMVYLVWYVRPVPVPLHPQTALTPSPLIQVQKRMERWGFDNLQSVFSCLAGRLLFSLLVCVLTGSCLKSFAQVRSEQQSSEALRVLGHQRNTYFDSQKFLAGRMH